MQLVGVIDLLGGQAVHARGGHRDRYRPVTHGAGQPIPPGDAAALARAYVTTLGLDSLYVADIDAIRNAAPHDTIIAELTTLGVPIWLDAGIADADDAGRMLELGVARVVIGLETLPSFKALAAICTAIGAEHVVFSLDTDGAVPRTSPEARAIPRGLTAGAIATMASEAGAQTMIALDLSLVGTSAGPALNLVADVRGGAPAADLIAGGGVRNVADLAALAKAGCNGALVATALQNGTLDRDAVTRARALGASAQAVPGPGMA
jgi:phosphoribosylformimino-5-aminoimidazole carboxamide ribotide isomerase